MQFPPISSNLLLVPITLSLITWHLLKSLQEDIGEQERTLRLLDHRVHNNLQTIERAWYASKAQKQNFPALFFGESASIMFTIDDTIRICGGGLFCNDRPSCPALTVVLYRDTGLIPQKRVPSAMSDHYKKRKGL